jgi:adenylylsulfate kinase-like enzyme
MQTDTQTAPLKGFWDKPRPELLELLQAIPGGLTSDEAQLAFILAALESDSFDPQKANLYCGGLNPGMLLRFGSLVFRLPEIDSVTSLKAQLESDVLRQIFTLEPRYDDQGREACYLKWSRSARSSRSTEFTFDATANRRRDRDRAREQIPRFIRGVCGLPFGNLHPRDPKGIYRKAREREADTVPGLQSAYEPPENAELVVDGDRETPEAASRRVMIKLAEKGSFSDH